MADNETFPVDPETIDPVQFVQVMPGNRVRINPLFVRDFCAWLWASRSKWETAANRTVSGLTGEEQRAAKAHILYAKHCMTAIDDVITRSVETSDRKLVQEFREVWEAARRGESDTPGRDVVIVDGVVEAYPMG